MASTGSSSLLALDREEEPVLDFSPPQAETTIHPKEKPIFMNGCTGLLSTATRPSRCEVSLRCHVDSRPSGMSVSLIKTTRYREAVAKNTQCRKSQALPSVCSKQPYSRRDV